MLPDNIVYSFSLNAIISNPSCIILYNSLSTFGSITKDTIIGEILDLDETTAPYFLEMGMHCLGCPSARGETLEQACAVHGVDAEALVKKINEHLSK